MQRHMLKTDHMHDTTSSSSADSSKLVAPIGAILKFAEPIMVTTRPTTYKSNDQSYTM